MVKWIVRGTFNHAIDHAREMDPENEFVVRLLEQGIDGCIEIEEATPVDVLM